MDEDEIDRLLREIEERESRPRPEDELWPDAPGVGADVPDDEEDWEG